MDERLWKDRAQRMEQVLRQILTLTSLERAAGSATEVTDGIEDIAHRALRGTSDDHDPVSRRAVAAA